MWSIGFRPLLSSGGTEAALSAEIVVSPQEAFWGALVPMRVPLRRTCPGAAAAARCGRNGARPAEAMVKLWLRVPRARGKARGSGSALPPGA